MKKAFQRFNGRQKDKSFIRRNELLISGILMLCLSIYMGYSGELISGHGVGGAITRYDSPVFFWTALSLWSLLGMALVIAHFVGPDKTKRITDYINNKKL